MTHGQGHKANDVFAPRGALQSGVSADFFALGYDAFGSLLPGRNYSSDVYRFGFQGQEKDDEINGATGTSYAYTFRMHDPRIGRFLSIDPLAAKYPYWTPYAFSGNMVIQYRELEGLEPSIDMRANRAAALSMSPQEAIHHVQMMDKGDDIATNMVSRNGPLMTDMLLTGAAYATGGASAAIPVMLTILTGVPVTPSPAALEATGPILTRTVATEATSTTGPLRFSQRTASAFFSEEGAFSGRAVASVADDLRSGAISPSSVPIETVPGTGTTLIVNTRSSLALKQAGIPESSWNIRNMAGTTDVELSIANRLKRNNLTGEGTDNLRITGSGSNASTYRPE